MGRSFGPILVRPPSSAAGTEDDGNLGQWSPVDPGSGTLGRLGIQLLNLSLASFALQLIIVALAIWHCIHFIATPELEPGQRHKLGTPSCCHEGNIVTGDIHCVLNSA